MAQPRRGVVWMRLHKEGRKRLAKLLLIQGVTHRDLAEAVQWKSHGMVSQLLNGTKTGVKPESAVAIAKHLGVELSDLFVTEMPSVACRASSRAA